MLRAMRPFPMLTTYLVKSRRYQTTRGPVYGMDYSTTRMSIAARTALFRVVQWLTTCPAPTLKKISNHGLHASCGPYQTTSRYHKDYPPHACLLENLACIVNILVDDSAMEWYAI